MKINQSALDAIRAHGAEGYPNEICGVLIGPPNAGIATEAKRARNMVVDRPHDRYEMDTRDQIRIEREARVAGLDVVGYYHSHPDHPARPSIIDTEKASTWYVYVILSVEKGTSVTANGFVLDEGAEKKFRPEPLEIV